MNAKQLDEAWKIFETKMRDLKKRQQAALFSFERRLAEKRIVDLKKEMGIE